MDELWQRYRVFWVPVLYGVGAFLAGLIAVHVTTSDPEAGVSQNNAKAKTIKNFTAPGKDQLRGAKNADALTSEADAKARLVDQRHGDGDDAIEAFVRQALRAAILRGSSPADVERFDGDAAAAAQATTRYEALVKDRVNLLRSQDPNVAFSRLRADVVGELSIRANRADVDDTAAADEFGHTAITSVDRSELPRRLSNLALIATVLDAAIREGVRSIDGVAILPPEVHAGTQGGEQFLAEWPVKIDLTGTPEALTAILNLLTDPLRPTPLGTCSWKQTQKKDGTVKAEMRLYSVRVRPAEKLGLDSEGGTEPMVVAAGFFVSFLLFLALGLAALVVTAALDKAMGKERALLLWSFALVAIAFLLRPAAPPIETPRPKPLKLAAAVDPTLALRLPVQVYARPELPRGVRNAFEEQSDTHPLPPEKIAEPPDSALPFPIPPTVPGLGAAARRLYRGTVPATKAGDGSKLPDVPPDSYTSWQAEPQDVFDWILQGGKRYYVYIRAIDDVKEQVDGEPNPKFDDPRGVKWNLALRGTPPAFDRPWNEMKVKFAAIGPEEDAKKLVDAVKKASTLRVSELQADAHEQWFLRRSVDNLFVEACRKQGSPSLDQLPIESLRLVAAEMAEVGAKGKEGGLGWKRAIEALRKALDRCKAENRNPAEVLSALIEAYRAVHDDTRLMATLADYVSTATTATAIADGATRLGDLYDGFGLADVAVRFYDRALQSQPGSRGALAGRGDALSRLGSHGEALKAYRAAAQAGARTELAVREAEAALRVGSLPDAKLASDAALGANAFDPRALLVKGAIQYATGDVAGARDTFAQASVLPGDGVPGVLARRHRAEALYDLGLCEWRLGHGDAASAAFDATDAALRSGASRGRSPDETVCPELGRALLQLSQGNVSEAADATDRAREQAGGVAYVEMLAGWLARQQGDPTKARTRFEAALTLLPDLGELDGWLADARLAVALAGVAEGRPASDGKADFDAAVRFAQRATEREAKADPKNTDFAVREAMTRLRRLSDSERKRFADALKTAEAVLSRTREERRALAIKGYCNYRLGAGDPPRYEQCLRDFQAARDIVAPDDDPFRVYATDARKTVVHWLALEEKLIEFAESKLSGEWETIESNGIRVGPDEGWLVFGDPKNGATQDGSPLDPTVAAKGHKLFNRKSLEKVRVWISIPKESASGEAANKVRFGLVVQPPTGSGSKALAKNQGFGLFYDQGKVAVRVGGGMDPLYKDGELHRVKVNGADLEWPDPKAGGGGVLVEIERRGEDGTEIVLRLGNQEILKDRIPSFKRTGGDLDLWLGGWSDRGEKWDVRIDNISIVRSKG